MRAKSIMTKDVITFSKNATVGETMYTLVRNKISGAPIVDREYNIIGLITEKDLLVAYNFRGKTDDPIKEFMTTDVTSAKEDTSVEEIIRLIIQRNIKRVPILKGKKVVGIVSRRDVIACILKENSWKPL